MLNFIGMQLFFIVLIQVISWTALSDAIKTGLYVAIVIIGSQLTLFFIYKASKSV